MHEVKHNQTICKDHPKYIKNLFVSQAWWCMPVFLVTKEVEKEYHNFKASLSKSKQNPISENYNMK
jgi:hypothetical protein